MKPGSLTVICSDSGTSLIKAAASQTRRRNERNEAAKFVFGTGWCLDLPSLNVDDETVYATLPDGQTYKADSTQLSGLADYKLSDVYFKDDTTISNGTDASAYKLVYANGSADYFTEHGEILMQTDRFGNAITYYWTESDSLRCSPDC
jgi:hypothetical protein